MRYEHLVGLRYVRARHRNRFIGVNALISIVGIAVGVWALIVVLSVVNGFREEVRSRILSFASHIQIVGLGGALADWRSLARAVAEHPRVAALAPFVHGEAMFFSGGVVRGALVRGVDPREEERVADFARYLRAGSLDALTPGRYGVVLGADLARALGVGPGDTLGLVVPQAQSGSAALPRLTQLTVVGLFEAGFQDADAGLALLNLADAQALFRMEDAVSGVRLRIDDPLAVRQVSRELLPRLPDGLYVTDWTRAHGNFFRALETTKRLMFAMLVVIILVAAINVVSTLVVMVSDKQGDIAILRTLGATPPSVMRVFVVHGLVIGVAGALLGVASGVVTALNIEFLVRAVERAFQIQFLSKDIYLIDALPSRLLPQDVALVALTSLALSFLATLYPSWRAARTAPAEALRHE